MKKDTSKLLSEDSSERNKKYNNNTNGKTNRSKQATGKSYCLATKDIKVIKKRWQSIQNIH